MQHIKYKDLTGKIFDKLTVIKKDINLRKKKAYWICQCECGNEVSVRGSHLSSKQTRSCGCLTNINLKDKKFGKLTVIFETQKRTARGRHKIWLCLCECGKEKLVSTNHLTMNQVKSCGCFQEEKLIPLNELKINHIYSKIKSSAKQRNIKFEISKKFIEKICFENCFFCGGIPDTLGFIKRRNEGYYEFYHSGIDRVNPLLGYIEENCVSCCKKCNWMKRNMTYNEWIDHIKKILEFIK